MALILAIQPDEQQAAILSGVVMNQLRADLVLVDSKEAALAYIRKRVPDLILLAAELGRPDDEEFASRLRKVKNAEHLRTLSMPPLGSSDEDDVQSSGGLLKAFKRKRVGERRRGRDPKLFTKELRSYLKRAERIKADRLSNVSPPAPARAEEPAPAPSAAPPPPVEATSAPEVRPSAEPTAVTSAASLQQNPLHVAAEPTVTFESIETQMAFAMRVIHMDGVAPDADSDAIIRALRVPSSVAGFAYPRGCRIGRIRLASPPRQRGSRRPGMEPPPAGTGSHFRAAL